MMIEEFEKLTGIYPSAEAYTVIESYYLDYPGTKQDFCLSLIHISIDDVPENLRDEVRALLEE